ncbi:MAG: AsmA family protein [Pseudomonadales bacterium]|nr:AsmA family protein [Pseudomonadales bacterium]
MSPVKIIIAIVVLIPVALFAALLVLLDNPELFRDRLSDTLREETGFELNINGGITWRYWPPVAINIEDVSITPAGSDVTLASVRNAAVDLELFPLLSGTVSVAGLNIDGLTVNAIVDENGLPNWSVAGSEAPDTGDTGAADPGQSASGGGSGMALNIGEITISNALINYADKPAGADYQIDIETFSTGAVIYDQLTALNFVLRLQDKVAGITANLAGEGQFSFGAGFTRYQFRDLQLQNRLSMPDMPEQTLSLTLNGAADLDDGTARLEDTRFEVAGLQGSTRMSVSGLNETLTLDGNLSVSPFNANQVMKALGMPAIETANPQALSSISVTTRINGTLPTISLSDLQIGLDSSSIKGSASVTLGDILAAGFDLKLDQITVSDYLPPAATDAQAPVVAASTETAPPVDSEVIPVDLLRQYALDGKFSIGSATYDTFTFNDISLAVKNATGRLNVDFAAAGYEGKVNANINSTLSAMPTTTAKFGIQGLNITQLTGFEWITGIIALDAGLDFKGRMLSEVLDTLDGNNTFTITDGTLDVTPVKSVATSIDNLRGKTSSVAEWPDKMPFKQLNGKLTLNDGIEANQQLNVQLENMSLAGTGGIDYWQSQLAYDIEVVMQETVDGQFRVHPPIAGLKWPLHCEGAMTDSPVDLCFPDGKAVQKLVTEIVKQEVKRQGKQKLQEKIEEKLPDEIKDKAKDLLKGLFGT